jgi:predicted NAD-dependent protein-ADP-ribosyltransferase YbiA (DUF1768 family)
MRRLLPLIIIAFAACSAPTPSPTPAPTYPAAWFAPLPAGTKVASWEITPDAAKPGEAILSKRTELGVFSNFAATPFELDGKRYASIEGLWQSMYYPEGDDDARAKLGTWPRTRAEVEQLTAFEAKRAGDEARKVFEAAKEKPFMTYRGRRFDSWGSEEDRKFHLDVIERATRAKVEQNPAVKELLLRTGELVLKPDHHQPKDAPPSFFYFEILMRLRAELRR